MSILTIHEVSGIQCDACGGCESIHSVAINGRPIFLCPRCLSAVRNGCSFPLGAKVEQSPCGNGIVTLAPFAFIGREAFVRVPREFFTPMGETPSFIVSIMGLEDSLGPCLILSWLYASKSMARAKANKVFLEACVASGVTVLGMMMAYSWLVVFGRDSWRSWRARAPRA